MTMSLDGRPKVPPTEVQPKAKRRTFSAEYKRRIVRLADACTEPGALGALLRREGLYSSHLAEWRAARERGELEALGPKPRGPAPQVPDARDHDRELEALRRDLARMTARAERAEALIEVQKKSPLCWARPSTSRPGSGHDGRRRARARARRRPRL